MGARLTLLLVYFGGTDSRPSFPRKRESSNPSGSKNNDIAQGLLGPRLRGDDAAAKNSGHFCNAGAAGRQGASS
jgi:hypothetical protein